MGREAGGMRGRGRRQGETEGEEGVRGGEEREGWKVTFWNVAGLGNKDKDFWEGLREWEVMVLMETWVEEKDWKKIKRRLPSGYEWGVQWAGRRNKKGRARGGMVMGIRKEMIEGGTKMETGKEGFMVGRVKKGGRAGG